MDDIKKAVKHTISLTNDAKDIVGQVATGRAHEYDSFYHLYDYAKYQLNDSNDIEFRILNDYYSKNPTLHIEFYADLGDSTNVIHGVRSFADYVQNEWLSDERMGPLLALDVARPMYEGEYPVADGLVKLFNIIDIDDKEIWSIHDMDDDRFTLDRLLASDESSKNMNLLVPEEDVDYDEMANIPTISAWLREYYEAETSPRNMALDYMFAELLIDICKISGLEDLYCEILGIPSTGDSITVEAINHGYSGNRSLLFHVNYPDLANFPETIDTLCRFVNVPIWMVMDAGIRKCFPELVKDIPQQNRPKLPSQPQDDQLEFDFDMSDEQHYSEEPHREQRSIDMYDFGFIHESKKANHTKGFQSIYDIY